MTQIDWDALKEKIKMLVCISLCSGDWKAFDVGLDELMSKYKVASDETE